MEFNGTSYRRRWLCRSFTFERLGPLAVLAVFIAITATYDSAKAAELVDAHLSGRHAAYNIRTEVLLAAEPATVRSKLIEYGRLPALNPNIVRVGILPKAEDGGFRLRMHTRACFLLYCQQFQWVQRVSHLPDGQIFAVVEASDSDFRSGWFRYRFIPEGDDCRLILEAQLEPKDGISNNSVVRAVMKRVLADEAITLAQRLEAILS